MKRKSDTGEQAKHLGGCPNRCCGGDPLRQRRITDDERRRFLEGSRIVIVESSGPLYLCDYCGCLYIRANDSNIQLGILSENPGPGWHTSNFP